MVVGDPARCVEILLSARQVGNIAALQVVRLQGRVRHARIVKFFQVRRYINSRITVETAGGTVTLIGATLPY